MLAIPVQTFFHPMWAAIIHYLHETYNNNLLYVRSSGVKAKGDRTENDSTAYLSL